MSKLQLYEPMMFHRLLVQALFPNWNETVKELLARLSCARDLHSLLADTEVGPKSRKRFDDVREELAESGLLQILDKVEREIIRSGFLSGPE